MTLRTLRITTIAFVSHLLLAPLAFTSQLPTLRSPVGTTAPLPSQEVTIKARQQEKQGDVYKLDGDAEVLFQSYVIRAEHVTYNDASGVIDAMAGLLGKGTPAAKKLQTIRSKVRKHSDANSPTPTPPTPTSAPPEK